MNVRIVVLAIIFVLGVACNKKDQEHSCTPNQPFEYDPAFGTSIKGGWTGVDNLAADRWYRYTEPLGNPITDVSEVTIDPSAPSGDSTVYHLGILHSAPYTNVYRYQVKDYTSEVNWTYTIRFKFRGTGHPPQGLEFPFSIYTGTHRLEMAMQWVSPVESGNPRWRVWGGTQGFWNDQRPDGTPYNFRQHLAPDVWHSFTMSGKIQNDSVYYDQVISDCVVFPIGERYPAVASTTPAQTVVAIQLNNNFAGGEQHVYIDDYSVRWWRQR